MHKIAIQLSGQIRYWHKSYNDWVEFKSSLQERGFDVDLHICGWEDEYTKELEYDIFTTSNLIPINKDILRKIQNQMVIGLVINNHLVYYHILTYNIGEVDLDDYIKNKTMLIMIL